MSNTKLPTARPANAMSATEFKKTVSYIKRTGENVQNSIHMALVSALTAVKKNDGNINLVTDVFAAVPGAVNAQALIAWVRANSNLNFSKEKQRFVKAKGVRGERKIDLDAAFATPFWLFKEAKGDAMTKDLQALCRMVVRAENEAQKTGGAILKQFHALLPSATIAKLAEASK